jgi:hypothetical protein
MPPTSHHSSVHVLRHHGVATDRPGGRSTHATSWECRWNLVAECLSLTVLPHVTPCVQPPNRSTGEIAAWCRLEAGECCGTLHAHVRGESWAKLYHTSTRPLPRGDSVS